MIRFTAKTKGGLAYDPICSAIYACYPILKNRGWMSCTVETENGSVKVGNWADILEGKASYFDSKLSADQRRQIALKDDYSFVIKGDLKASNETLTIHLINDASTIPECEIYTPGKTDKLTNGDISDMEMAYFEAWAPSTFRSRWKTNPDRVGTSGAGLRPFYNVVCEQFDENEGVFICHGPDAQLMRPVPYACDVDLLKLVGAEERYPLKEVPVFYRTGNTIVKEYKPVEQVKDTSRASYWFKNGSYYTRVQLTQTAPKVRNTRLNLISYFHALCICSMHESRFFDPDNLVGSWDLPFEEGRGYVLNVEPRSGYMWLCNEEENLFRDISQDPLLSEILDRYQATDTTLFVKSGDLVGKMSSTGSTKACFALSLGCLISLMGDGSLVSALTAFLSIVDAGCVKLNKDTQVFTGEPSAKDKHLNWYTPTWGRVTMKFSRSTVYNHGQKAAWLKGTKDEEYCLVGYDPWETNSAVGESDHYVVCQRRGDKLIAVYDPYRAGEYVVAGNDLTHLFEDGRDFRVVTVATSEIAKADFQKEGEDGLA